MMDHSTALRLANLRRQIAATGAIAGDALTAVRPDRDALTATPFLSACADELEALAGLCRKAANEAGSAAR